MGPIVPTLQCGLFRSNFSFAITQLLAPSSNPCHPERRSLPRRTCATSLLVLVGLIIRANEFLFLDQLLDNLPIELREIFREALAKNLKPTVPNPEIPHEPRRWLSLRCPLHLRNDFLRHRSRSLLIARKVHRVFRAALR